MKVKDYKIQIKAGPDDGLQEGQFKAYASVFGNIDSYGEAVVKGAFEETLSEWATSGLVLPILFGHNMVDPDFNIGGVIEAKEDDHGLLIHGELDLENPKAVQVYRLLKGRRINQLSFAYDVLDSGPAEKDDTKYTELRKLKLYEVSIVPIGANQETEVLAVKSIASALQAKAGRVLSAKNEESIKSVRDQLEAAVTALTEVLSAVGGDDDQEKASTAGSTKADEEPRGVKSAEESGSPSALDLVALAEFELLGL